MQTPIIFFYTQTDFFLVITVYVYLLHPKNTELSSS